MQRCSCTNTSAMKLFIFLCLLSYRLTVVLCGCSVYAKSSCTGKVVTYYCREDENGGVLEDPNCQDNVKTVVLSSADKSKAVIGKFE